MDFNRTKNTARNIAWGVIYRVIATVLPFVMRSVIIYTLGTLYLGLNGLFASILQVLNLSEMGVSAAIVYCMYKPLADGDDKMVSALMKLYRTLYRIIGLVVAVVGLALVPFLDVLISGEVPADINIRYVYLIQLGAVVLTYELFAYRTSLLVAVQRNDLVSRVNSIVYMLQSAAQLAVLIIFKSYYAFVFIQLIADVSNNLVCAWLSKRRYPQFSCSGTVDDETKKEIKEKVFGLVFQKVGGVVVYAVDPIIISAFLGLDILAKYQNYYVVVTGIVGFLTIIQTSMTASVGNSVVKHSEEKNYRDFLTFNFMYICIIGWCSACMVCLYQPFVSLWVGEGMLLPVHTMVLLVACFFLTRWQIIRNTYIDATGIWWETRWVQIGAAVFNLVVNIILVQIIGLDGVILSTILSMLIVSDPLFCYSLFKYYFKGAGEFKGYVLKEIGYCVVVALACALAFGICSLARGIGPWLLLIVGLLVATAVCAGVFVLFWHRKPEFADAMAFVKGVLNRKRD